jgi:periplasmic protein TonB
MFDAALLESGRRHRLGDRKKSLPVAIALHAATVAAFVGATMWNTGEPPDPVIPVIFPVTALPPPPLGDGGHRTTETRIGNPPHPAEASAPNIRELPLPVIDHIPPPAEPEFDGTETGARPGDSLGVDDGTGDRPGVVRAVGLGVVDGPIQPGGDVKAPLLVSQIEPDYPESMRRARVEGVVILEAVITASGEVDDIRVLKSAGAVLDRAASDAVRRWRYCPATLNGRAVSVSLTVTVQFGLSS